MTGYIIKPSFRMQCLCQERAPRAETSPLCAVPPETRTSEARAAPPKFLALLTAAGPAASGSEHQFQPKLNLARGGGRLGDDARCRLINSRSREEELRLVE